jgi:hypothetical protein
MNIIQVGPDELASWDMEEVQKTSHLYEWFVYWYKNEGYDGSGEAVALRKEDGMLVAQGLGHCSCYGPLEGWSAHPVTAVTVEEFLRPKDSIFDLDCREAVMNEVKLLLLPK